MCTLPVVNAAEVSRVSCSRRHTKTKKAAIRGRRLKAISLPLLTGTRISDCNLSNPAAVPKPRSIHVRTASAINRHTNQVSRRSQRSVWTFKVVVPSAKRSPRPTPMFTHARAIARIGLRFTDQTVYLNPLGTFGCNSSRATFHRNRFTETSHGPRDHFQGRLWNSVKSGFCRRLCPSNAS